MGKIAFVFSGQGAQKAGMGKSFYDNNETVKDLFDRAETLRNPLPRNLTARARSVETVHWRSAFPARRRS